MSSGNQREEWDYGKAGYVFSLGNTETNFRKEKVMKKSISGVSTLLLMTLMLTSCAAVPESKTEDGVNYAVSDSEKAIEEAVRNGLEDKAQFIEKNGDGYTCVCDLAKETAHFG